MKQEGSHYKSYLKKFNKTLAAYKNVNGAKFVINEEDMKRGIFTIPQNLTDYALLSNE